MLLCCDPAQIWLTYTFKHLTLGYAVMICIIHDWVNMSIEIYIDKKTLHKYE